MFKIERKKSRKVKIILSLFILWITMWIWFNKIFPVTKAPNWIYVSNLVLIGILLTLWNIKDLKN